ncbi:MAG: aminotransferase class I/II-fold pyridoxal phosphate-dependent enzyme [Saprospiraceae bacterium]|nr:aminotransferase class I/II-fold pyridoxal phosphate-dependent enzyme [Saprospiraceae bacterium]
MDLTSKLPNSNTSIFAVMTALATKHNAINLAQGFPDYPISGRLMDLVYEKMKGGFNQYAPMPGLLTLRESIASKLDHLYQLPINVQDEITVVAGATQGIFTSIQALVGRGDEVIIFEPAYDSYIPSIKLAGAIAVPIALEGPNFSIDWDFVASKINDRTKLILINTPHNPSGTILIQEDWNRLYDLIKGKSIMVLSDEVYEHLVFENQRHVSLLQQSWWRDHGLAVYSFGKTLHATGWKLGYIIAPSFISKEIRKVHQFEVFSCNTPIQAAIAEYILDSKVYSGLPSFFQEKRDYLNEQIAGSLFHIYKSAGTYFTLVDYRDISNKKDTEFAKDLVEKYGIATIPLSVFYTNPVENQTLIRLCFAKEITTLKAASEILNQVKSEL